MPQSNANKTVAPRRGVRPTTDRELNVMTTKELTALEEQIGSEQVLIKKYHTLCEQCTDPTIRTKLESIAAKHRQHFDTLMGHLN